MKQFIQISCIIVMIYSGVQLAKYVYTYFAVEKELEEVQQVVQNEELTALQDIHPNIVGWLTLEGTRLNNPILQAADNDFYLRHNYKDEESRGGSIFMDFRNDANELGRHTIFYGHVLRNGTMFGDLDKFAEQAYANEHPLLSYETTKNKYELYVFAAYETTTDFYYIETNFNDDSYMTFVNEIKERSVITMPVTVNETDRIVTFSTCTTSANDEERFVVHAKVVEITN